MQTTCNFENWGFFCKEWRECKRRGYWVCLVIEAGDEQAGVMAAEAEGVAEGGVDFDFSRFVGDVIEWAFGVGVLVVDGGGQDSCLDGFGANG